MPRTQALTRPIVLLLTVALALAGLVSASASASAVEPRHITGTVTGTGGVPLADVNVTAIVYCSCEGFATVGTAQTADDGTYHLGVAPNNNPMLGDTVYLHFEEPTGGTGGYAPEYYNNAVSVFGATGISVSDGGTASGKDAQLALAGHITGTVTGPGGTPVAGAGVYADFADPDDSGWAETGFYTKTAEDGSYDLSKLPASIYTLSFSAPGYRAESYPTNVIVTSGTTVRRNARLSYRRIVANLKPPTIIGKAKVGRKVTAKPGSWNPADVTTTYRWLVAGRPVAGATHASYKPRSADVGKKLRVRVTAAAPRFRSRTVTSVARTIRNTHRR